MMSSSEGQHHPDWSVRCTVVGPGVGTQWNAPNCKAFDAT